METSRRERFRSRFLEHYSRLCGIAYGILADREEAEDIVQEIFLNVWDKGKDDLKEKEFAAYMTVAVRNRCISFLRRQRESFVSIEKCPVIADSPQENLSDANIPSPEERIDAALKILPPRCRDIFKMSKLKGMKYREIAGTLEISEKTVENQMTKAVKLLRAYAASEAPLLLFVITIILSIIANNR